MANFWKSVSNKAVSLAYFALLGGIAYGVYWYMSSLNAKIPVPEARPASKPSVFILESPKFRKLMGPPVEDVMDALGGPGTAAKNVEY